MKKKIYDIIPPQNRPKEFSIGKIIPIKETILETKIEPESALKANDSIEIKIEEGGQKVQRQGIIKKDFLQVSKKEKDYQKKKFSFKKQIIIVPVLLAIIIFVFWFFSSAKKILIELVPVSEPFSLDVQINLATSTNEFILPPDLSQAFIPVETINIEKDFKKEFPAEQVLVEEKAKGVIRVYNKSTRNVSLVENTRFLSSSEPTQQFQAVSKIATPAGGYVDVPVIASGTGAEYNIEPCVFSLPGLRNFSPPQLYYDIYGKSFSKMEGGRKETIFKITKESTENAQKELLAIARQEIESALQTEAGKQYRIIGDSIELELIGSNLLNAQEGQEMEKFVYQIKVKAKALMAKTENLTVFGKAYMTANIPSNKEFINESLEAVFPSESGGALAELKTRLRVSAKIHSIIDEESLKEIVKGRDKKEIVRYSAGICPDLAKEPRVIFEPFWARKASLNPKQIEISIILE
ncbi:MAG: hypothetical protein NTY11_02020 [Candidatus Parcubacteria bacterium]|nr:hypothetical protein [Candidatus Parcubacteria bacterium]